MLMVNTILKVFFGNVCKCGFIKLFVQRNEFNSCWTMAPNKDYYYLMVFLLIWLCQKYSAFKLNNTLFQCCLGSLNLHLCFKYLECPIRVSG